MLIKTKMKIKFYKIAGIFLLLSMAACDVERIPETQISDASFWKSESDVRSAANYLYTFLPGFTRDEVWSDNAYGVQSCTGHCGGLQRTLPADPRGKQHH
jgi:hypothetical protein